MITEHENFILHDLDKKNAWHIEVNWRPKDNTINECKILKITHPNGDVSLLKKEHLQAILFAIGTEAEQRDMIPKVQRTVMQYETVLGIKATKDIKKGEMINFPLKLELPVDEMVAQDYAREKLLKPRQIIKPR